MSSGKNALEHIDAMSGRPSNSKNGSGQNTSSSQILSYQSQNQRTHISVTLSPLLEIWSAVRGDILQRDTKPKYPIGLRSIDELLWGIHKKELLTIGARTSHGKTSWAINMVRNLADSNNRIIYFSLEMSKEQILEKLLSNLCEINNIDMRKGFVKEEVLSKEKIFVNWIREANLLIDDRNGYNFDKLLEVIEIIKPDFIVIDYIQMISAKGFRSKLDAIEEYVRRLKQLCVENNFGIILISQINRSGEDGPSMSKLKWAGILEEHSDTVLILSYNKDDKVFRVCVEKQRHGEVGNAELKFIPEYSGFREFTDSERYLRERAKSKKVNGGLYTPCVEI